MRRLRNLCLTAGAVMLGGCSTISGMQKPVVGVTDAVKIPPEYQRDAAIKAIGDLDDAKAVKLRNQVIGVYVNAIDARYHEFRGDLSKNTRQTNLGLDLGAQGASTLGAVVRGSANEFSALAALLVGTRASVNKELFYERTLPAIVATMDANRLRARGAIISHLGDSITAYPLTLAFADLATYELAGNMDSAVNSLSAVASQAQAEEFRVYEDVIKSCKPVGDVAPYRGALNRNFYALGDPDATTKALVPENLTALAKIAEHFDVEPQAKATTADEVKKQIVAINREMAKSLCSEEQAKAMIVEIKAIEDAAGVKLAPNKVLKPDAPAG